MILVLTGTHHQGFDRLVHAADALAQAGERVVVQSGASRVAVTAADSQPWFSPDVLAALAQQATIIITHAGPASVFLAWEFGKRPVVVARSPRFGEHVDDHQLRFVTRLRDRAVVVTPGELVADWVRVRAAAAEGVPPIGRGAAPAFVDALDQRLSALTPRAGGWRATLRRVLYGRMVP